MSETASLLLTSAERFLERHLPAPGVSPDPSFVRAFGESGLHLVMAPEEAGGLGASVEDAAALAHCWGAHAAP